MFFCLVTHTVLKQCSPADVNCKSAAGDMISVRTVRMHAFDIGLSLYGTN